MKFAKEPNKTSKNEICYCWMKILMIRLNIIRNVTERRISTLENRSKECNREQIQKQDYEPQKMN